MAPVQFVGQIIYRFSEKLRGLLVKQDNVWDCVLLLIDSSLTIVVCKKIMVLFFSTCLINLLITAELFFCRRLLKMRIFAYSS